MPPLLIITALLTIAAAGAWGLIRRSRARMLAEQRATVESERLAAEARLAHEKAMAEAKARDDARQQAEAEERSRKETEARENARLEEKRGLAAEAQGKRLAEEIAFAEAQARETVRLKAEAEARQRAEAEEREKARLVAQEEDLEYRQAQEKARAEAEMRERAQIAAEEEALRQTEEKVAEVNSERGPVSDARPPPNPEKSQESFNRSRVTKIGISEATRRVEPERRAGGQMESSDTASGQRRARVRGGPQLRLVCFKDNDRMWRVAVELPEDYFAEGDIEICHDEQPLTRVAFSQDRWPLHRLAGLVKAIEAVNARQRWELDLGDDERFLFKLLKENEGEQGRLVSGATRGDYLLLTPKTWRKSACSGIQPRQENNVDIEGYVGWRFRVDGGVLPKLEFRSQDVRQEAIRFRADFVELVGKRGNAVFCEYDAPVFLETPPTLRTMEADSWSQVHQVVLGMAGSGEGNWRMAFPPSVASNELSLSEHLTGKKGGWFFVRLYDADEVLLDDGIYFAFARGLRSISVSGASVLPAPTGHTKARLEFEHEAGAIVEAADGNERQASETVTSFTIAPCFEQVDWQISWPDQMPLRCTTRIQRVWWALGSQDIQPVDWTDKPLTLKPDAFRASSEKAFWIRLPGPALRGNLDAGFGRATAHRFPVPAQKHDLVIPLREFESAEELQKPGVSDFSLWVALDGHESSTVLARVETAYRCKYCEAKLTSLAEARLHALGHTDQLIRELTLDEMRHLLPDLPVGSYKCDYCLEFVHSGDFDNPTSAICSHIESKHPGAPVSFYVVSHVEEYRQYVLPTLPRIQRCKCGQEFTNAGVDRLQEHLRNCARAFDLFTLA